MFDDRWSGINPRNGNLVKFFYDKATSMFTVIISGEHITEFRLRNKGEAYKQYNLALI